MLKVGDKVRYSNEYLKAFGPRSRHWNKRRGKQQVMTVISVTQGQYDWKNKKYTGNIVKLDRSTLTGLSPYINTYWLRFVRRDT